jgi:hypothetical protein
MENDVECPRCGSYQVHAERRGWSLMIGALGMNRIVITCLSCGYRFRPGRGYQQPNQLKFAMFCAVIIIIFITAQRLIHY